MSLRVIFHIDPKEDAKHVVSFARRTKVAYGQPVSWFHSEVPPDVLKTLQLCRHAKGGRLWSPASREKWDR